MLKYCLILKHILIRLVSQYYSAVTFIVYSSRQMAPDENLYNSQELCTSLTTICITYLFLETIWQLQKNDAVFFLFLAGKLSVRRHQTVYFFTMKNVWPKLYNVKIFFKSAKGLTSSQERQKVNFFGLETQKLVCPLWPTLNDLEIVQGD